MRRRFYPICFLLSIWISSLYGQNQYQIEALQKILRTAGQDSHRVKALCNLCLLKSEAPDSALLLGRQGFSLAEKIGDKKHAAQCLHNIGKVQIGSGEAKNALFYFEASLKIAKEIKDLNIEANCLKGIGGVYYNQDKYQLSLSYCKKAKELFIINNDTLGLLIILINIADSYNEIGEYVEALTNYQQSLRLSEKIGNTKWAIRARSGIGTIYQSQKKYDKAFQTYRKNLESSLALGDKSLLGDAYTDVGVIYCINKNYDKAIEYFQKAKDYYEEIGYESGVAGQWLNIGDTYGRKEQFPAAFAAYQKAQTLFEAIDDKDGLSILFSNMSLAYLKSGLANKALVYNQKGLALALETGVILNIMDSYRNLAQIDSALGDFAAAYAHCKLAMKYEDSLFSESKNKQIAELETKYETEKKEQKINALRIENELQQRIKYGFVGISVISFGLFSVSYVSYRNKKRSNIILQAKNVEIYQQKEEIIAQSEQISIQLSQLQELDSYKQALGAMLIHDLKNPLSSIIHLSDQEPTPRVKKMIHQAGQQMLNLVLNLLDVHKFENAEIKLNVSDVSMAECAQNALEQATLLLENKKQHLIYDVPPNLAVRIDKDLVERVLINLLTNAVKYTPNNGTITLTAEPVLQNGAEFVKFSVTDTGQGIPADKIHLVFEKFGQVEARNSGLARSTGLGLTFCKMAIEAHGGIIDVLSEFGNGASFFFTLPRGKNRILLGEKDEETFPSERDYGQTESLAFTEDELAYLRPYIKQMQAFDVYEITDIESVLDTVTPISAAVLRWKEEVENAVHFCNDEEYKQALSI